ncbi:MAG: hypothetical protein WAL66_01845 [Nitrososphaeraceae archaeon]
MAAATLPAALDAAAAAAAAAAGEAPAAVAAAAAPFGLHGRLTRGLDTNPNRE